MMVSDFELKQIELLLLHGLNVSEICHLIESYFYPDELIKLETILNKAKGELGNKIIYHDIKKISLDIYLWHLIKDTNCEDGKTLVNESHKDHGDWIEIIERIEHDVKKHQSKQESIQSKIEVDIAFEAEPLYFWGGKPDLAEMALMLKEDGFYNFYNCSCGVPDCGAATLGCFVLHRDRKTFFFAPDDCIKLDEGHYVFRVESDALIQSFNHLFKRIDELALIAERIKLLGPDFDIEADINLHPGFNAIKHKR